MQILEAAKEKSEESYKKVQEIFARNPIPKCIGLLHNLIHPLNTRFEPVVESMSWVSKAKREAVLESPSVTSDKLPDKIKEFIENCPAIDPSIKDVWLKVTQTLVHWKDHVDAMGYKRSEENQVYHFHLFFVLERGDVQLFLCM